jgi:hypothetical protein
MRKMSSMRPSKRWSENSESNSPAVAAAMAEASSSSLPWYRE